MGGFVRAHSGWRTPSSIEATLLKRLRVLEDRGFVEREGITYRITEAGLDYLNAASIDKTEELKQRRRVERAIREYNDGVRAQLRQKLGKMNPYAFEHLVKDLLEAMGYEDVEVTRASGDKGIDVAGTVQVGITAVTEVVQVKRHQGSINRPVLDQLRGSLHYFKAIHGTIITLGGFSPGCKEAVLYPGAAPITLTDGDRLLDPLIQHGIGVRRVPVELL